MPSNICDLGCNWTLDTPSNSCKLSINRGKQISYSFAQMAAENVKNHRIQKKCKDSPEKEEIREQSCNRWLLTQTAGMRILPRTLVQSR